MNQKNDQFRPHIQFTVTCLLQHFICQINSLNHFNANLSWLNSARTSERNIGELFSFSPPEFRSSNLFRLPELRSYLLTFKNHRNLKRISYSAPLQQHPYIQVKSPRQVICELIFQGSKLIVSPKSTTRRGFFLGWIYCHGSLSMPLPDGLYYNA